jgi:hypothetical protein
MQSSRDGNGGNLSDPLHGSLDRCILLQSQVYVRA